MITIDKKTCTGCGKEKLLSAFRKYKRNMGDGYSGKCYSCRIKMQKERKERMYEYADCLPI